MFMQLVINENVIHYEIYPFCVSCSNCADVVAVIAKNDLIDADVSLMDEAMNSIRNGQLNKHQCNSFLAHLDKMHFDICNVAKKRSLFRLGKKMIDSGIFFDHAKLTLMINAKI